MPKTKQNYNFPMILHWFSYDFPWFAFDFPLRRRSWWCLSSLSPVSLPLFFALSFSLSLFRQLTTPTTTEGRGDSHSLSLSLSFCFSLSLSMPRHPTTTPTGRGGGHHNGGNTRTRRPDAPPPTSTGGAGPWPYQWDGKEGSRAQIIYVYMFIQKYVHEHASGFGILFCKLVCFRCVNIYFLLACFQSIVCTHVLAESCNLAFPNKVFV